MQLKFVISYCNYEYKWKKEQNICDKFNFNTIKRERNRNLFIISEITEIIISLDQN